MQDQGRSTGARNARANSAAARGLRGPRLTGWPLVWRLAASVAGILLLLNGSLRMSDDVWPFGPLAAYKWVQYGSGVFGLVVVAVWLVTWVRRRSPIRRPERVWVHGRWATLGVGLAAVVGGLLAAVPGDRTLESRAVAGAVWAISMGSAAIIVVAIAWQVAERRRRLSVLRA